MKGMRADDHPYSYWPTWHWIFKQCGRDTVGQHTSVCSLVMLLCDAAKTLCSVHPIMPTRQQMNNMRQNNYIPTCYKIHIRTCKNKQRTGTERPLQDNYLILNIKQETIHKLAHISPVWIHRPSLWSYNSFSFSEKAWSVFMDILATLTHLWGQILSTRREEPAPTMSGPWNGLYMLKHWEVLHWNRVWTPSDSMCSQSREQCPLI